MDYSLYTVNFQHLPKKIYTHNNTFFNREDLNNFKPSIDLTNTRITNIERPHDINFRSNLGLCTTNVHTTSISDTEINTVYIFVVYDPSNRQVIFH